MGVSSVSSRSLVETATEVKPSVTVPPKAPPVAADDCTLNAVDVAPGSRSVTVPTPVTLPVAALKLAVRPSVNPSSSPSLPSLKSESCNTGTLSPTCTLPSESEAVGWDNVVPLTDTTGAA